MMVLFAASSWLSNSLCAISPKGSKCGVSGVCVLTVALAYALEYDSRRLVSLPCVAEGGADGMASAWFESKFSGRFACSSCVANRGALYSAEYDNRLRVLLAACKGSAAA